MEKKSVEQIIKEVDRDWENRNKVKKQEHFDIVQNCLLLIKESLLQSDNKDFFKHFLFASVKDALTALSHFDPRQDKDSDLFIPPY